MTSKISSRKSSKNTFQHLCKEPSDKELEDYARECVRLAGLAETPELRDQLLQLAREWLAAAMEKQAAEEEPHANADAAPRANAPSVPSPRLTH